MQQQTCQDGENIDAFLIAVARLYETQELPAAWASLMDEGRLTERTLRAVLRAEKDFLENPDAELHPLALPHPTHALGGAHGADAATDPAAAAQEQPVPAAEGALDAGTDVAQELPARLQPSPQPPAIGYDNCRAAPVPVEVACSNLQVPSPLPGPGLTPRCPGVEAPGHRDVGASTAGGFSRPGALGGLSLPPEVLAALGPQEAWPCLPSSHALAGQFNNVPGSMEPLITSMGLSSDMHPSGQQTAGAFGAIAAGGALAAGHGSIWSCLPSLRGLYSSGYCQGGAPAAGVQGGFPPADPLRLLEPYGALHDHHSSSSSAHTRPDSALEYEHPAQRRAAAADSLNVSRHSSSRPDSSLSAHLALGARPSASPTQDLAPLCSAQPQQPCVPVSQAGASVGVAGDGFSLAHMQPSGAQHVAVHPVHHSPDTGVERGLGGVSHLQTVSTEPHPGPQYAAEHSYAAMHPWLSAGQQRLACSKQESTYMHGKPAGSMWPQQLAVRGESPEDSAAQSDRPRYAAHQVAVSGDHDGHQNAWSAAAAAGYSMPAGPYYARQQQTAVGYAAAEEYLPHTSSRANHQAPSVADALPVVRLKHAHSSSTQSPFARHAESGWGAELPVQEPTHTATAVDPAGQQEAQPGCWSGSAVSSLISPRCVESPMAGALQHLLDSAAAQAGVSAQDICAWLASANAGHVPAHLPQQQQARQDTSLAEASCAADAQEFDQLHAGTTHSLTQLAVPDRGGDNSLNTSATTTRLGADGAQFACSILETLLGPRQSAQLSDMLLSPAGMLSTAALLQGSLPPTPAAAAALTATAALQAPLAGLKRERSTPEGNDELLIEQPGSKLHRVF